MWKVRDGSHILSLFHLPFNINLAGEEIYILDEIASLSNGKVAVGCIFWDKWPLPRPPSSSPPLRAVPPPVFLCWCCMCVTTTPICVSTGMYCKTYKYTTSLSKSVYENQFISTSLQEPVYLNQSKLFLVWSKNSVSFFFFCLVDKFHFNFFLIVLCFLICKMLCIDWTPSKLLYIDWLKWCSCALLWLVDIV